MEYYYEGKIIEWENKDLCPLCQSILRFHRIKGCNRPISLICDKCGFNSRGVTLEDGKVWK